MSDDNTTSQQPQLAIQRIYLKDLSFETPNTPMIFQSQAEPAIELEINSAIAPLAEHVFEVVLSVTVTNKIDDKVAYLIEVQQAGIFTIAGFPEDALKHILHTHCPNTLFPYAREVVSDMVSKGSFPQLLLAPINFEAIYAQYLQQQAHAAAEHKDAVH